MKKQFISAAIAVLVTMTVSAPLTVSANEWVKTDSGYVYEYDNGTNAESGWLKIDGKTYYIKKDGTRQTGWLKTKTANYYFDKNGVMQKSKWITMKSGAKYYLDSKGKAASGIVTIDDIEYKFDTDGKCLGENTHFILNSDTMCLHSNKKCRAALKIDEENYSEIDIGFDEFKAYSNDGYWACGVGGCNDKDTKKSLPKPKK